MPPRRSNPLIKLTDAEVVFIRNLADRRVARLHAFGGRRGRQGAVQIMAGQIQCAACQPVQQGDAIFRKDQAGQAVIFRAGVGLGAANKGRHARHHQNMCRIAAQPTRARFDVTIEFLRGIRALMRGEDHLGVFAANPPPSSDCPAGTITGCPCGLRDTFIGPFTLKCAPL